MIIPWMDVELHLNSFGESEEYGVNIGAIYMHNFGMCKGFLSHSPDIFVIVYSAPKRVS
jgi:hypothetical protein